MGRIAVVVVALLTCLAPVGADAPPARPLAWEIAGERPSLLLGLLEDPIDPGRLPDALWRRLESARILVLALDSRRPDWGRLLPLMRLPPGRSLESMLPPADWATLRRQLPAFAEADLRRSQPWAVLSELQESQVARGTLLGPILIERAVARRMPLGFIETLRRRVIAFNRIPHAEMLAQVRRELSARESRVRRIAQLTAAYREGDLPRLTSLLLPAEDLRQFPRTARMLGPERLDAWLPRVREHLPAGGAFIALPVGTFLGTDNLRTRLAAAGYRLRRLTAQELPWAGFTGPRTAPGGD